MSGSPTFDERFQAFAAPSQPAPPFGAAVPNPGGPAPTAESALSANDNSLSYGSQVARQGLASSEQSEANIRNLLAQREALDRRRQAEMGPEYDAAQRANAQPLPQLPHERPIPKAPTREDAERTDGQQAWLTAAMFLGVLGGALTRRPLTNALSAFTGVVEGQHQASEENFAKQMKLWEAANKEALEANEQTQREYERILKNRSLSVEQKKVGIQLSAMKYDDQAAGLAARMQGEEQLAKLIDQRTKYAEQLDKQLGTAKKEAVDRSVEAFKATPGFEAEARKIAAGEIAFPSLNQRNEVVDGKNQALIQRAIAINPDVTAADFGFNRSMKTAAGRILGQRGENIQVAAQTAASVLPLAAEDAGKVNNTAFKRLNYLINHAKEELGDPVLQRFATDNFALTELYARVLNPNSSTITNYMFQAAADKISTAASPSAYAAMLGAIRDQLQREYSAVQREVASKGRGGIPDIVIPDIRPASLGTAAGGLGTTAVQSTGSLLGAPASEKPGGSTSDVIPGYNRGRGLPPGWDVVPK